MTRSAARINCQKHGNQPLSFGKHYQADGSEKQIAECAVCVREEYQKQQAEKQYEQAKRETKAQ